MNSTRKPLDVAIQAAVDNVRNGGGPFGAVVVSPDGQSFVGVNRVTASNDPTAHAEVTAIRLASSALGFDLSGCTLYTSCYPCPMCLGAALWARVDRVVYAATAVDAAGAGFDDAEFYRKINGNLEKGYLEQEVVPDRMAPFTQWDLTTSRIPY